MSPFHLLLIQIAFSFTALSVLAAEALPWLRGLPRVRAVELLLWTHVPRSMALALLAPGQVAGVAPNVANAIAWGDFLSAVLALASIVAIRSRGERAIHWVWLFSAVSSVDIVTALTLGLGSGVYEQPLGVTWFVLTLYVPLVCLSQALLTVFVFKARTSPPPNAAA